MSYWAGPFDWTCSACGHKNREEWVDLDDEVVCSACEAVEFVAVS